MHFCDRGCGHVQGDTDGGDDDAHDNDGVLAWLPFSYDDDDCDNDNKDDVDDEDDNDDSDDNTGDNNDDNDETDDFDKDDNNDDNDDNTGDNTDDVSAGGHHLPPRPLLLHRE